MLNVPYNLRHQPAAVKIARVCYLALVLNASELKESKKARDDTLPVINWHALLGRKRSICFFRDAMVREKVVIQK